MHVELAGRARPNIILPSRRERDAEAAVRQAMWAARGVPRVLPVVNHDGVVGHLVGRPRSAEVLYCPQRAWSQIFADRAYDCAISTYDGVVAAGGLGKKFKSTFYKTPTTTVVANNWYDLWPVSGSPVAGTYSGTARTAKQWDDTLAGGLYHGGNVSTDTKYVSGLVAGATANTPTLMLYDRVLVYEACTFSTSNQAMTNGVAAQRYIGSGEPGLQIAVTCQTTLGATAAAFTQLQYTDNAGNTLQSAPNASGTANVIVSALVSTITLGSRVVSPSASGGTVSLAPFYPLAAGDAGVQLIDNYTFSAANTGTLCFVLAYPLAYVVPGINTPVVIDHVLQVGGMPIVKDGAHLNFMVFTPATTGHNLWGTTDQIWG